MDEKAYQEQLEQQVVGAANYVANQKGRPTVCGWGSRMECTVVARALIERTIEEFSVKTMIDIGCGDFHWMSAVDLHGIAYLGLDVLDVLIENNRRQYSHRQFDKFNLVTQVPPPADLLFCRDLLGHLPNELAKEALGNLLQSRSHYLAITTNDDLTENVELPLSKGLGVWGWRRLNVEKPPYNLRKKVVLAERELHGTDKFLKVYDLTA